jgi:hypothetical protein
MIFVPRGLPRWSAELAPVLLRLPTPAAAPSQSLASVPPATGKKRARGASPGAPHGGLSGTSPRRRRVAGSGRRRGSLVTPPRGRAHVAETSRDPSRPAGPGPWGACRPPRSPTADYPFPSFRLTVHGDDTAVGSAPPLPIGKEVSPFRTGECRDLDHVVRLACGETAAGPAFSWVCGGISGVQNQENVGLRPLDGVQRRDVSAHPGPFGEAAETLACPRRVFRWNPRWSRGCRSENQGVHPGWFSALRGNFDQNADRGLNLHPIGMRCSTEPIVQL